MHYRVMFVHPATEEAGAAIGEIVHKHGGTIEEKRALGILMYEATFQAPNIADVAKLELEAAACVSHVDWAT